MKQNELSEAEEWKYILRQIGFGVNDMIEKAKTAYSSKKQQEEAAARAASAAAMFAAKEAVAKAQMLCYAEDRNLHEEGFYENRKHRA